MAVVTNYRTFVNNTKLDRVVFYPEDGEVLIKYFNERYDSSFRIKTKKRIANYDVQEKIVTEIISLFNKEEIINERKIEKSIDRLNE